MRNLTLMLNCIKNGQISGQNFVVFDFSNSLYFVLKVLAEEGFIKGFLVKKDKDSLETKKLHVLLKYKHDKSIIDNIVRQPKNIVFFRAKDLQKLSIGIGVYIISTSKGFMTSDKAFHMKLGGEVLSRIQ